MKFCPCQNKPGEERESKEDPTRKENKRDKFPSLKTRVSNRWKSIKVFGNKKAAIPAWQTNSKPGKHAVKPEEKSRDKTRGKGETGNIRISTKRKDTNPTQPTKNAGIPDDTNENRVRKHSVWNRKRGVGSIQDVKAGPHKEGGPGKIGGMERPMNYCAIFTLQLKRFTL